MKKSILSCQGCGKKIKDGKILLLLWGSIKGCGKEQPEGSPWGFKAPEDSKLADGIDDKKWNKWKEEGWIIKIK